MVSDMNNASSILNITIEFSKKPIKFIDFINHGSNDNFKRLWNADKYEELMNAISYVDNENPDDFSIFHAIMYLSCMIDMIIISLAKIVDEVNIYNSNGDETVLTLPHNRFAKVVYLNTAWNNIANNLCQLVHIDNDGTQHLIKIIPKFVTHPDGFCEACNCTFTIDTAG
jgi:hypothetical protein